RANLVRPAIGATSAVRGLRADFIAAAVILLGVSLIYGARLTVEPLVGEETRWATAAREMLSTGDWVVPRQQGQVFAERPPLTTWLMAIGGWMRGDVDPIAARLPSVIAVVLTSLLIFGYTRAFASVTTALIAALVYATGGQVLQIGRLGESEAVFTLFVGGSLLVWHLGYARNWRPVVVWTLGFSFAALAAMVKGPQAPIYFVAITGAYLVVVRDWKYLLSWQPFAGGLAFVAIIAAWQIPFYRATDWQAVLATWAGLAGDRIHLRGVLAHSVSYPLETFGCLLPWSPMLTVLALRDVREWLREKRNVSTFIITALVVAYPTVWLASGARGRYFMPLYPLVAVLIGLLIEYCSHAVRGSAARRMWQGFLLLWTLVIGGCAALVGGNALLPSNWALDFSQPRWFVLVASAVAGAALYAIVSVYKSGQPAQPLRVVLSIAGVAGLGATGLMLNYYAVLWSDPTSSVSELAAHLPEGAQLVSLTEIEHRFAYYYGAPITQLPWPMTADDLPANVDYFCFMRHWNDTPESHIAGRGRTAYRTPGTLPFAWEEVMAFCPDRQTDTPTATSLVLGRVIRPIRAEVSDISKPQNKVALEGVASERK
ncbi:MAG TPA: glycosyltransferase family 39 protein, partial [Lacipirellulaceae bacterium]|nr:glycosyltransferase family 39 protein [Lacipirellulaceae bacterium]